MSDAFILSIANLHRMQTENYNYCGLVAIIDFPFAVAAASLHNRILVRSFIVRLAMVVALNAMTTVCALCPGDVS